MQEKQCRLCGATKPLDQFPARSQYPSKRSNECRQCCAEYARRYRERVEKDGLPDIVPMQCEWCGATYTPKQRRPKLAYCSRKCKHDARNAASAAARVASKSARECLHCGGIIGPERRADAKFCSADCNSRAHGLSRSLRVNGDREGPGYVRAYICKRDGWKCGICGGRVDPDARHPDPGCASIDHIVPVSQGGTSDPANLRLTHLRCNLSRRAEGGGEQLALVG